MTAVDFAFDDYEDTSESAWLAQEGTLLITNAVAVKLKRATDGKVVVYPWSAIERVVTS